MQEFNKYELLTLERNFISFYGLVKNNCPTLFKDGKYWYKKENKHIKKVAKRYGMTVRQYAEITARLSIRNNWIRNRLDAVRLSYNKILGRPIDAVKVCTTKVHKNIAYEYCDGIGTIQPNALKIHAFAKNLQLNKDYVTIDVWIKRAFTNCWDVDSFDMNSKQYEQLSNIIKKVAKEENLIPYQVQAIAWNGARNNIFNKDTIYIKGMYSEPKHKTRKPRELAKVQKNIFSVTS